MQGLSKLKLSLAFIENVIGLNNSLKALNRAQQKVVEYLFPCRLIENLGLSLVSLG